ncbi:MAG: MarC family protein [Gemmatimonadetes bacterium]|nr:MarC family protein [Gemmatimonadota bacterium]NNM06951.1 MarC family protein [Gemmatimonadota bacterium]
MSDHFLYAFVTLIALMAPVAELPVFLGIVEGQTAREIRASAMQVAFGSFVILGTAAVAGQLILLVFGVSLPAFRAAGGAVLIVIGLEMLKGTTSALMSDSRATPDPQDRLWMPMIMPLTAGPAAITTAITLAIREKGGASILPTATVLAIGASTLVVLVLLLASGPISKILSARSARLSERFLGLILTAVGFQMGMTGILEFFFATQPQMVS